MGQGETASFEYLVAPFHLPDNQLIQAEIEIPDNRRLEAFISLVIRCGVSNAQLDTKRVRFHQQNVRKASWTQSRDGLLSGSFQQMESVQSKRF